MIAPHILTFTPFVQRTADIIPEALYEVEEAFQVKQASTRETRARFRGLESNNRIVAGLESDVSTTLDHSDDEPGSEACNENGSKDAVNTSYKGKKKIVISTNQLMRLLLEQDLNAKGSLTKLQQRRRQRRKLYGSRCMIGQRRIVRFLYTQHRAFSDND